MTGIVISGYLSYAALFNSAALACGAAGGCHIVQDSTYSEIAEIPISVFGLAMYSTLLIVYLLQTNQANSLKDKASANLIQGIRIWP
ncbi:MAG: vitamin K epoxide reductase family protein, partial [Chloroflexota bacterium]|nr:vitamin K epoxide reductase family protein [Chloroflexota bacterium]